MLFPVSWLTNQINIERSENSLTQEIKIKIFESQGLRVFLLDLSSDGDAIYSTVNLFRILGTPMKPCLT